jgi:hypothetical protein
MEDFDRWILEEENRMLEPLEDQRVGDFEEEPAWD